MTDYERRILGWFRETRALLAPLAGPWPSKSTSLAPLARPDFFGPFSGAVDSLRLLTRVE